MLEVYLLECEVLTSKPLNANSEPVDAEKHFKEDEFLVIYFRTYQKM